MSIYEKRRRIIQNQALILALAIICNFLTFPIIPGIIVFLYATIPQIFVPVFIGGWFALLVFTICIDSYALYRRWKERHGYGEETDYGQKNGRKQEKHGADKGLF